MAKRGRKSAAQGAVSPPPAALVRFPGRQRPKAPTILSDAEAVEWNTVVDCLPADWFPAETHGLLIAYCRHNVSASKLSVRISQLQQGICDEDVALFDRLLKLRDRECRAMSSLATRLRITPQARTRPETAATQASTARGPKPWEFGRSEGQLWDGAPDTLQPA